jgi:adenine/guanine phosphoribosyltransferase-like PRPP-binding protein
VDRDTASRDREALAALLLRVGLKADEPRQAGTDLAKFDPFGDPAATDLLGRELAGKLRDQNANVVCVWEEPEDMVLGHILGLALGVRWMRCVNADGLVALVGSMPAAPRCAIVTDAVRATEPILAMRNVVEVHGGKVVVIAALLSTKELESLADGVVATVSLTSTPARER